MRGAPLSTRPAIEPGAPSHVAIIMDGNRRWASLRGKPPWYGHQAGFAKVADVASWAASCGIRELTLWMLSTDNLNRPAAEVGALFPIIERAVDRLIMTGRYTLRHIGRPDALPDSLQGKLEHLPARADADMIVNLAIGHGGLDQIERAVRRLIEFNGERDGPKRRSPSATDVYSLSAAIDGPLTAPDLIIRTSGERRLSGFLLWSSAGAQFRVLDPHWPDFGRQDLLDLLSRTAFRR